MTIKERIVHTVRPIHRAFRHKKIRLFLDLIPAKNLDSLLDIGGGTGIDGEFLAIYRWFNLVTLVNLQPQELNGDSARHCRMVLADGCRLPFPSQSFDWVFSNAVIEHVGGWERQKAFADEIRRVAIKGYFVTTPDKYFPIEPHTLCPFYQFLPVAAQKRIVGYTPGYLSRYEEINLLSFVQFQRLFPEAQIRRVGFPIWGNSLVAQCRLS